jgi:hypothetical protein
MIMKKLILAALASCMATVVMARPHKNKINVIAEASAFLNINANEIQGNTALLKQKSVAGGSFGAGVYIKGPLNVFLQATMGLRFSSQRHVFTDGDLNYSEKKVNSDYYLRFLLGYSFPVSKNTRLAVGVGFQNYFALKKRDTEYHLHTSSYTDQNSGETLKYVSDVYGIHWGDARGSGEKTFIPFVFNPVIHAGIINNSILPGGRQVGLGLEFSKAVNTENNNGAQISQLDPQRNVLSTTTFRDSYAAVSLRFFVDLF